MSDAYLGEIRLFSFGKNPTGWSFCDGSILKVEQNEPLFKLIGNKFGGSATETFALPDLRGRTPLGLREDGSSHSEVGLIGGSETVQLTKTTVPSHSHNVRGVSVAGRKFPPGSNLLASVVSATPDKNTDFSVYQPADEWKGDVALAEGTVGSAGGNQPHPNMQPFATLNYCIATSTGVWPPRP